MGRLRLVAAALAATALVAALGVATRAPSSRAAGGVALRLVPQAIVAPEGRSPAALGHPCHGKSAQGFTCYQPAQLRVAYDLAPLYAKHVEGQHETIVIVDCYGAPTVASDLRTFDQAFHLPAPPSLRVIHPTGAIPPYSPTGKDRYGWATETDLDVEWAHALAPKASILLVETPTDEVEGTSGFPDIVAAEHYVLDHHLGTVISQSFTATEQTFSSYAQLSPLRSAYVAAAKDRVTVLAGSGDLGATDYESDAKTIYPYRVTSWPASDPLVTSVGGTRLDLSASGTALAPAVAWNDTAARGAPNATGGGVSTFFARPAYQAKVAAVTGAHRGVPDVAMSASCTGLVDTYVGVAGPGLAPGWQENCGTSEATPLFAAIVALCDQEAGHGLGQLNPALYAMLSSRRPGLVAVTSGNNTVSFVQGGHPVTVSGYDAGHGYTLVTGVGTIDAATFVPSLVATWRSLNP